MNITGYQAYKYYLAVKLHFTQEKFDVFVNPKVKATESSYHNRNDKLIFEKLARVFKNPKDLVSYYVANLLYDNDSFLYNYQESHEMYKIFKYRKDSLTYVFKQDLQVIEDNLTDNLCDCLLNLYLCKKITVETVVIFNEIHHFLDDLSESQRVMFQKDLLKIKKAKGFVKHNSASVLKVYTAWADKNILKKVSNTH